MGIGILVVTGLVFLLGFLWVNWVGFFWYFSVLPRALPSHSPLSSCFLTCNGSGFFWRLRQNGANIGFELGFIFFHFLSLFFSSCSGRECGAGWTGERGCEQVIIGHHIFFCSGCVGGIERSTCCLLVAHTKQKGIFFPQ